MLGFLRLTCQLRTSLKKCRGGAINQHNLGSDSGYPKDTFGAFYCGFNPDRHGDNVALIVSHRLEDMYPYSSSYFN